MHRCLQLAAQGQKLVGNGAMVGAVLVRGAQSIAEGWHRGFGLPHAECDLLENVKGAIEPNDILYVNLEPCSHTGKTLPCADLIIERGVRHVVYGMVDPDERNCGAGLKKLRERGVAVIGPVCLAECEELNRGFTSVRTKHRPWITLKRARTKDGRIANVDGSTLKITTEEQDRWSHTSLRCRHDAILLGVGTIVTDNPILDTRLDQLARGYQPWRIVLDPSLRIPITSNVVTDDLRTSTIIICNPEAARTQEAETLRSRNVKVFGVAQDESGIFVWDSLWRVLTEPQKNFFGITSILVEGGEKTWKCLMDAENMDSTIELHE